MDSVLYVGIDTSTRGSRRLRDGGGWPGRRADDRPQRSGRGRALLSPQMLLDISYAKRYDPIQLSLRKILTSFSS